MGDSFDLRDRIKKKRPKKESKSEPEKA